jgi:4-carboxymuconolactone decarboxylase
MHGDFIAARDEAARGRAFDNIFIEKPLWETNMTDKHKRKSGKDVFKTIFGDKKSQEIETLLHNLSPDLVRIGIDFPFGEFYAKDDLLDLKTRELVTISSLVTQATLPQLKLHIEAALNVGCTPVEIEQAIIQLVAYIGMPKVINAMKVFREVLDASENKA